MIDVRKVTAVLLADGWHSVRQGTFEVEGRFEYVSYGTAMNAGDYPGFSFDEPISTDGVRATDVITIRGPLTSILAVQYSPD